MESFARYIARELDIAPGEVKNYAETTDRYVVYKAGRVLSVSVSTYFVKKTYKDRPYLTNFNKNTLKFTDKIKREVCKVILVILVGN